jgi:protein HOOK3
VQTEALSKQAAEAAALRDQVDDLRHVADKLDKSERALEAMKRKAEEATTLKAQLRVRA